MWSVSIRGVHSPSAALLVLTTAEIIAISADIICVGQRQIYNILKPNTEPFNNQSWDFYGMDYDKCLVMGLSRCTWLSICICVCIYSKSRQRKCVATYLVQIDIIIYSDLGWMHTFCMCYVDYLRRPTKYSSGHFWMIRHKPIFVDIFICVLTVYGSPL